MGTPHTTITVRERDRARQALDLKLSGETYATIAARLGWRDESGPRKAVYTLLDRVDFEHADEFRTVENAKLDKLHNSYWQAALDGDIKSAAVVLRIMERRAKLLGLDRPVKVELSSLTHADFIETAARLVESIAAEPEQVKAILSVRDVPDPMTALLPRTGLELTA